MKVDVSSLHPTLRIEVDAECFGKLFAGMPAVEQVEVLRSMVEHMKPHAIQWDYIAIELEKEDNFELRRELNRIFDADG